MWNLTSNYVFGFIFTWCYSQNVLTGDSDHRGLSLGDTTRLLLSDCPQVYLWQWRGGVAVLPSQAPPGLLLLWSPTHPSQLQVYTYAPSFQSLLIFFSISQPFILGNDSPATCSPSSHYPALCLQLAPLWSKVLLFLSFSINVPCTSLGPCKRWQVFGECDSQHSSGRAAGPSIIRRSNHYRECGQTSWSCCD